MSQSFYVQSFKPLYLNIWTFFSFLLAYDNRRTYPVRIIVLFSVTCVIDSALAYIIV